MFQFIEEHFLLLFLLLSVLFPQPFVFSHGKTFFGSDQLFLFYSTIQTFLQDGGFHVVVCIDEEWLVQVTL